MHGVQSGKVSGSGQWGTALSWGFALGVLGFAVNWFKLALFQGIDFIFGSVFVMLAAGRFGILPGITAGAIAASCTFLHWNHPWSIIVFTGEALIVGWLYHRHDKDLVFADIMFWLFPGIPLSWALHHFVLRMTADQASFIVSKQAVNGILNTLLGSVILICLNVRALRRGQSTTATPPPIRSILFNGILALILAPALFIMITGMRDYIKSELLSTVRRVHFTADSIRNLHGAQIKEYMNDVERLSREILGMPEPSLTTIQSHIDVLRETSPLLKSVAAYRGTGGPVTSGPFTGVNGVSQAEFDRFLSRDTDRTSMSGIVRIGEKQSEPAVFIATPLRSMAGQSWRIVAQFDLDQMSESLGQYARERGVILTILDRDKQVVFSSDPERKPGRVFNPLRGAVRDTAVNDVFLVAPPPGEMKTVLQTYLKSAFLTESPLGNGTDWTFLVESPIAPYYQLIKHEVFKRFLEMFFLVFLALTSSYLMSNAFSHPLAQIAELTTALPQKLIENRDIKWPQAVFREMQTLLDNIGHMSSSLSNYLSGLREANETLEQKVAERTRNLEESERRFRHLVEEVPNIPVQGYDRNRQVIFWNRASEKLYGFTQEEALGKPLDELIIPPHLRDEVISAIRKWLDEGVPIPASELTLMGKGGKPIHVFSSHVLQRGTSGEPVMYCIDVDLSARRQAEQEVQRLNRELEMLVRQRTEERDFSTRELEGFCYAISHELRGPIARLQGFCDAMSEECGKVSNCANLFYARRINVASRQLRDVVDAILTLSRLSTAEITRETINLSAIAEKISSRLARAEKSRRLQFIIEPDMTACCDKALIQLCLENLIGNAVKYSSKVDAAVITFGQGASPEGDAFFVRDNGAGFDMAFADKLFKPFLRLHKETEFEGTGIGLVTVARIIERHGGKIWGESREGEGATFWFTLGGQESS